MNWMVGNYPVSDCNGQYCATITSLSGFRLVINTRDWTR